MSTDCTGRICLERVLAEYYDENQICTYATYEGTRCPSTTVQYDGECGIAVPMGNCSNCEACLPPALQLDVGSMKDQLPNMLSRICQPSLTEKGIAKPISTVKMSNGTTLLGEHVIAVEVRPNDVRRIRLLWLRTAQGNLFGTALEAEATIPTIPLPVQSVEPVGKRGIWLRVVVDATVRPYFGLLL